MLTRRVWCRLTATAVTAGATTVLAGCSRSSDKPRSDHGPSTAGQSEPVSASGAGEPERISTALGDVLLAAPRAERAAWRTDVTAAAGVVAGRWGRGQRLSVTVCDDEEFAAVADGLDASTAAVTTVDGVFLGPALRRGMTRQGRVVVIAHELTHARLGQAGSDPTEWWLKEGAAEWTAAAAAPALTSSQRWPTLRASWASGRRFSGPPPDDSTTGAGDASLRYEWAHAYVTYLATVCGEDRLKKLVLSRPRHASPAVLEMAGRAQPFDAWLAARFERA